MIAVVPGKADFFSYLDYLSGVQPSLRTSDSMESENIKKKEI